MSANFEYRNSFTQQSCLFLDTGILFLFFILPLVACPLWGQAGQKKHLDPSDYPLWGQTHLDRISPDENWASFKMTYENGNDTLFVQNMTNNKIHSFPRGENSVFTKNSFFICQMAAEISVLNLKTASQKTIRSVKRFEYCDETGNLIVLIQTADKKNNLKIWSLATGAVKEIQNVNDFSLSPSGRQLVYAVSSKDQLTVNLIDLKKSNQPKTIVSNNKNHYISLTWQSKGEALAFLSQPDQGKITSLFYYALKEKKLYEFNTETRSDFPDQTAIVYDPYYKIRISDDLKNVFFAIKRQAATSSASEKSIVEIWNTNDQWIYPYNVRMGNFANSLKIAVWLPQTDLFTPVSTAEIPKIMLTGNLQNAVLFNPKDYEPQFSESGPSDFYIMNLMSFEKKVFLKKQFRHSRSPLPSPTGKFITYFKEENWWVYDVLLQTHTNLTAKIGVKFMSKNQTLVPESTCGSPGWSINDKEILIYDEFDIWAVAPDGNNFRRLTRGRESKIIFRIAEFPGRLGLNKIYDGIKAEVYDLNDSLMLRAKGADGKTGFYKWKTASGAEPIVYGDFYVDELTYAEKKGKLFFRQQKYDVPPQLMFAAGKGKIIPFYKSNPQHKKYFWGHSELFDYRNSKKQNLKGVLLYPADYDPAKKYPMIVNIYELQSQELHLYSNPTWKNESGFNPTLFTSEGYFVLLPDIVNEQENPGISATDCVISATQKMLDSGKINPGQIGLMGHSWGGYETSFIVSQTNLFSAAVPSGAITDLNSFYFTVSQASGKPEFWRFEDEEWNMRKTPFEAPQSYARNSPLVHAEKVTIPLLLWTGKDDKQVDTHQSKEYYLALRRLGKKSVMLLYPNEGHVISDPSAQKDITVRILQWFDYFLKNEKTCQWITDGMM
ncbi:MULTISPECIES: alpha/beta hydrolase family protein [Flavobacterium]|uniref:Dipeptidyl aminopeptidase/acylaminoacyl peptidase n=1 Tax=Flavobacterium cutihirudinis TaxID=1265740 RepID=A0A3D9G1A8_9FLAO|nr:MULTISPECIES: prolyl oligopeptidase family serine peptidase [Flavobacterium]MBZ4040937.1 prolyl oligopeptidase family serine peptidase [Flavobacterium hibisci]RED27001.1 dipeptidyl aminopeptidase/acylaminoacyl peptidase [Flavobacterium cutihirudinis]